MTPATGSNIEVELKYRVVDLAAAERYLAADEIGTFSGQTAPRSSQFEDRYVDTADGALARAGFAVRLRQTGKGTIVSVKSMNRTNGSGGSTRREELEGPADRTTGALEWPASDARSLVLELAGDVPLVELEAELVKGNESRLARLAEVFLADPALTPSTRSKLEAGMAAIRSGGHPPSEEDDADDGRARETVADEAPPKPKRGAAKSEVTEPVTDAGPEATETGSVQIEVVPTTSDILVEEEIASSADGRLVVGRSPGVLADDHIAEAGRKVMRFHLGRMLAREAGVRDGKDLEDVHAMRVATRRQRAAWRVFGEAYRHGRTRRYRHGLREVAGRLGAVRDLDVLLEAADVYRNDQPVREQRALEPLLHDWREHRDDARVLLIRELDSDAYRRWVDDYRDFVRTEGAGVLPVQPTQPHRVRDTAGSRVWAAYEQVRGYEPVLRWADVETLHELRIAGKWLRYTLEFVREALGDDAGPLIERVTALQDHLGLMNDANVSGSMARTFLVEHAGDLSELESAAIGRSLVSREREVTRLRRQIGPTWRGVAGVTFRRRLGRLVSGL